ncbi:hypothetical protein CDD80_131 [Ophiocordyceps camponoti-rufipedis]|uniref:DUF7029 domain-containing protein n=1 Tax=Ophiocordyceps camponoti-rufipedis TaxID=2004952 RepID=A0A2C5ZFB1_9HYPO|nr:hypothetical protein CDD80_131 [Ophiocordyceps camponoti-rufipedis]
MKLTIYLPLLLLLLPPTTPLDPYLDLNPPQTVDSEPPTLLPISNPNLDPTAPRNSVPTRLLSMLWAQDQGPGTVRVHSRMRWPTVLLEDIGAVTGVVCSDGLLDVGFDRDEALMMAWEAWRRLHRFVVVTNALGGCDAPAERGVYRASGKAIVLDPSGRRLRVQAERIRYGDAARASDVTLRSVRMPAHPRPGRRNQHGHWKRAATSFHQSLDMSGLELFRLGNTSLIADRLHLDASLSLSGKLRLGFFTVAECWFDISGTAGLDLSLALQVDAQLQRTLDRSTPALTLPLVAIPGIVAVGPAVRLAVGVDVTALASLYAEASLRVDFVRVGWHVDLVDGSKSRSTGLMPTFDAAVRLGGKASLHLDPFVDVRFLLNVQFLSGLWDLNGGIKVVPRIANAFSIDAGEAFPAGGLPSGPSEPEESPDGPLSFVLLQDGKPREASPRHGYDVNNNNNNNNDDINKMRINNWKPLFPQSQKSKKRKSKKYNPQSLTPKIPKPLRPRPAPLTLITPRSETTQAEEQQEASRKAKEGRRKASEVAVACRDGISLKSEFRLDVSAVLASWEWNLYRKSVPFYEGCYALPAGSLMLMPPP